MAPPAHGGRSSPTRRLTRTSTETFRTVLDGPTQAWPLYLAIVAQSLAAEIEGWVPWSLRGHDEETLSHLLSGVKMFTRDRDDGSYNDSDHPGGYVLRGPDNMERCTPSHPTYTYRFLVDNDLVRDTPRATIGRVLDWCRANLSHFQGDFTPQVAENHWQYRGFPPARRIIEGTPLLNPQNPGQVPAPQHWTAGCWGTSAFLPVLRSVNIPVADMARNAHDTAFPRQPVPEPATIIQRGARAPLAGNSDRR